MCGPENTNRPRGGALVALSPPSSAHDFGDVRGDLMFHTPHCPGSTEATHARLTTVAAWDLKHLADLHIVIHSCGDLTRNAEDCGMFRRFAFPTVSNTSAQSFLDIPLDQPLSLEVGNEGIIGRRVSLYSTQAAGTDFVLAEGIVGFNFLNPVKASI